ncbi:MAG: DUF4190 domain-containing protein [Mycobacterium sp.]|nr:DUF4190 domain-containing protein [Mycobacterium sp.]
MSAGYPGPGGFPAPTEPQGEVNTLATLSVVFAFVFAPAGALLGHLALNQIKQRNQRGRNRAVLGLTLSYVIIVLLIIALVVWLLLLRGHGESEPTVPHQSTTTTTRTTTTAPPRTSTSVVTVAPTTRPTVDVEELRVGDCVEIQRLRPNPEDGNSAQFINAYRAACEVRDGVFVVTNVVSAESQCRTSMLYNNEKTVFACYVKYAG